ncbi:MAG: hypothetical protein WBQ94_26610 [Terracidiphilus sp.]
MTLALFQILAIAAIVVYLLRWRAGVRRRNAQSWDLLLARLQPEWSARELIDPSSNKGSSDTAAEKWTRILGAHGLWAMYENAAVMMEIADYAARNSDSIPRELLADLRNDAMQIRVYVLITLAKYAIGEVSESIVMNALRVESAYAEMTLRMTDLIQQNAPEVLPAFEAAI